MTGLDETAEDTEEAPPIRNRKQYALSKQWERQEEERKSRKRSIKCDCTQKGCIYSMDNMFCRGSRPVGNMRVLMEKKDGSPVVIAGPCWPFCVFVTLPLVLVISGLVAFKVLPDMPDVVVYGFVILFCATLLSLFCVSCRDPGLIERMTDEEEARAKGWFWNEQVGSYRPSGALYCSECKAMIRDFDHVCPWTGTGIGAGNIVAFRCFVGFLNVFCFLILGMLAYEFLDL